MKRQRRRPRVGSSLDWRNRQRHEAAGAGSQHLRLALLAQPPVHHVRIETMTTRHAGH
jgi:hypothetical protein